MRTHKIIPLQGSFVWTLLLFLLAVPSSALRAQDAAAPSIHDFTVEDIFGDSFPLSTLEGKKVMIVNTASRCGLTPQYELLESLYQEYEGSGLVIIGFPANNFMNQEPGTNEEILEFCQSNYGVSFPMMAKVSVKGRDQAPIYRWLTSKELNGKMDSEVSWNFQKYLIDEQGRLVDVVPPRESPRSDKIIAWLEGGSGN
jgi:glutathione peroxidase